MNVRKLLDVNIFKTIRLSVRNISKGYVLVFNHVAVHAEPSSVVNVAGKLEIGRRYYCEDNRKSGLSLRKNSAIIVKADEQIYSGAYITVNENAILQFGGGIVIIT